MILPPVVSDPEGPCPGRLVLASDPEPFTRHDWDEVIDADWPPLERRQLVCCFCGGRKPDNE